MAAMAPSRTRGGVGRSQMPWPRLIPDTRSHQPVMRRMSDCARSSRRLAMRMRPGRVLPPETCPAWSSAGYLAQCTDKDVEASLQVGLRDLLVGVVAWIGL